MMTETDISKELAIIDKQIREAEVAAQVQQERIKDLRAERDQILNSVAPEAVAVLTEFLGKTLDEYEISPDFFTTFQHKHANILNQRTSDGGTIRLRLSIRSHSNWQKARQGVYQVSAELQISLRQPLLDGVLQNGSYSYWLTRTKTVSKLDEIKKASENCLNRCRKTLQQQFV